jgi:fibronectin-binding autotransporter adhesin
VTKSHRPNYLRRQKALRLLSVAVAVGGVDCRIARADSVYNGANSGSWNTATNWVPSGVPGTGAVADIFKTGTLVNYNVFTVVNAADLSAVQIANGGTLDFGNNNPNSWMQVTNVEVGGTNTGQAGRNSCTGSGSMIQATGTLNIDAGGILAVDSVSTYSLSGNATISCAGNEQLAGTFIHSGGANLISPGSSLINSGTYSLSNTNGGEINCDSYINSGTFNQNGTVLEGSTSTGASGTFNFNNSGMFSYTLGNFYGVMNNTGIVSVTSAPIPFADGIVNNGLLSVNGASGTYAGAISGNGQIIFKGATNVTLSGNNTYFGSTSVTSGTLILASPAGTVGNNFGGALEGNVTISANGLLKSNAPDQIGNTGLLTINGGTYNLNGYDESVGSLVMNAGAIQQATGTPAPPGMGVATGQITIGSGSATITGGLRSGSIFNFNISSSGTLSVSGAVSGYNSSATGMVLNGGGTLYFSGSSLLSTIDVKAGILQLSEGGVLGNANTSITLESGGSISLNNQTLTVGNLIGSANGTVALGSGTLTVISSSAGSTFPGTINGTGSLAKAGSGTLTLTGNDTATGSTTVSNGALTISSTATIASNAIAVAPAATFNLNGTLISIPSITANGTVNFGPNTGSGILSRTVGPITLGSTQGIGNGQVNVASASPHTNRTLLLASALTFSGTTNAWAGQLDLSNNDMIVHNGYLPYIVNQIKSGYNLGTWTGQGITSSTATTDTTNLTAVGVLQNDIGGGTPLYGFGGSLGLFDGYNAIPTDVLIKYTYFGDANLDGKVDGSDYSLIDNGYINRLTGWYNGDFNYDGVVDGSDYTLIDNTFNTQGQNLSNTTQIANPTAELDATSAVPEPGSIALLGVGAVALLIKRRGARHLQSKQIPNSFIAAGL